MTLVRLVNAHELSDEAKKMAESGQAQYGQLLHTWRAIMHRPELFVAYLPFLRAVAGPGELAPKLKDLSAVLVGVLNGCRYTISHRCRSASTNGATDAELEAVASHKWDDLDEPTRIALMFTEQLTVRPPTTTFTENRQAVDAEVLDAAKRLFTDPQLVELAMSVSVWNALARFHRVMDFELDMPAPPTTLDPAT